MLQSKTFKRNSLLRKMSHQRKILSMLANLSQYIFSNAIATYQKLKYATRAKRKCLHMEISIHVYHLAFFGQCSLDTTALDATYFFKRFLSLKFLKKNSQPCTAAKLYFLDTFFQMAVILRRAEIIQILV